MKYPWIDQYLLGKPGVAKDFKHEWNWIRYMILDKLVCAVCLDDQDKPYYITLKLQPAEAELLRKQYSDIIPGFYMNKLHWNSVKPDGDVPEDLMRYMLDQSYSLILNTFSKKKQQEILNRSILEE